MVALHIRVALLNRFSQLVRPQTVLVAAVARMRLGLGSCRAEFDWCNSALLGITLKACNSLRLDHLHRHLLAQRTAQAAKKQEKFELHEIESHLFKGPQRLRASGRHACTRHLTMVCACKNSHFTFYGCTGMPPQTGLLWHLTGLAISLAMVLRSTAPMLLLAVQHNTLPIIDALLDAAQEKTHGQP